ncbi:MAG TPA: class I tRNA ligase family protein, partial [Thermoanaerobaculia bacterium]|nr:class I tRNA ligase family protein [Thermoanaerobaculia bacterium]
TPAHDFNDYQVGLRHRLQPINIFTLDARLNDNAPVAYRGLDRFEARARILADLQEQGLLAETRPHKLMVPRCGRTDAVVEPMLTDQWFVRMDSLARAGLDAVALGEVKFVPENWTSTYNQWLTNIQDWCISRQLWWGHRIPAWYDGEGNAYVARTREEAQARYDEALAKLAPLEATWSSREGLSARAAAYRKSKVDEPKQQALLASIPAWERRKKPHEALDLLRGVEPTPHLRPQIEEARKRLEAQLAQLDKEPPQVLLRDGYSLEYSRGAVAELSFRVTDDYGVRGVKLMARAPGGKMREYPLEVTRTGGYYTAEMPSSFHQNGTVELYVVARDVSGNEGHFGTPDKPKKLTRIGSNRL